MFLDIDDLSIRIEFISIVLRISNNIQLSLKLKIKKGPSMPGML